MERLAKNKAPPAIDVANTFVHLKHILARAPKSFSLLFQALASRLLPSRDTDTQIDTHNVSVCVAGTWLIDLPGTRVFTILQCMFRQPSTTIE
jgi:hypothetical protein